MVPPISRGVRAGAFLVGFLGDFVLVDADVLGADVRDAELFFGAICAFAGDFFAVRFFVDDFVLAGATDVSGLADETGLAFGDLADAAVFDPAFFGAAFFDPACFDAATMSASPSECARLVLDGRPRDTGALTRLSNRAGV